MLLHSCAHSFLLNSSLLWFQSCVHSGDEDKKCGTKIYVVHNLSRKQRSLSPISREKKIFLILGLCRVFPLFTVLQMHLCISTTFLLTWIFIFSNSYDGYKYSFGSIYYRVGPAAASLRLKKHTQWDVLTKLGRQYNLAGEWQEAEAHMVLICGPRHMLYSPWRWQDTEKKPYLCSCGFWLATTNWLLTFNQKWWCRRNGEEEIWNTRREKMWWANERWN